MSSDPAMADGLNWYRYVGNNPIMYLDPTGLSSEHAGSGSSGTQASGGSSAGGGGQENATGSSENNSSSATAPQDNANGGESRNVSDSNTAGGPVLEQWQIDKMIATYLHETMSSWIGNYIQKDGFKLLSAKEFGKLSAAEQYAYLMEIVDAMEGMSPHERGATAMYLRSLRGKMKLKKLFKMDEDFMNGDLRDAMNLNYDGSNTYTLNQLVSEGFKNMGKAGSAYHQSILVNGKPNQKFVHKDGREVVLDSNGKVVENYPDKGTYNYVNGHWWNSFGKGGHKIYDMNPYDKMMEDDPKWERDPKEKRRWLPVE